MTRPLLSIIMTTFNQEVLAIRGLESIPRRDDIEVIVSDDCSTDRTWENVLQFCHTHPDMNIRAYRNPKNLGCFFNGNIALSYVTGEYIHSLDNDDFLYTDAYNRVIDSINGEDCVYMNLKTNDGMILRLSEETKRSYCAPICKMVRFDFVKDIKYRTDGKGMADWFYNEDILARNPVCKFTDIAAYGYNFPREGSVSDLYRRGLMFEHD